MTFSIFYNRIYTLNTFRDIPFLNGDGTYSVKIRGRRNTDFSQWSETFAITYLTSKPEKPIVKEPTDNGVFNNPMTFTLGDVFPKNVVAYNITLTIIRDNLQITSKTYKSFRNTYTFNDNTFTVKKGDEIKVSVVSVDKANNNSDPIAITLKYN